MDQSNHFGHITFDKELPNTPRASNEILYLHYISIFHYENI